MKHYNKISLIILLLFSLTSCFETDEKFLTCDPCTSPDSYIGFETIFQDEFNGATLGESWNYVEGNGCPEECGWGKSQELQYYKQNNVEVKDGHLILTAKKEKIEESSYTSGGINTLNKFSFTYGRIDVRAKLPKGQGIWPKIVLLGNDIKEKRWPIPGHISVLEMRGGEIENRDNTIIGKLIWGEPNNVQALSDFTSLKDETFNDKFQVFSIIWDETKIQWLLNDKVYFEQTKESTMGGTFNKPFHLNINFAVGGIFPGNPDGTTIFPQVFEIDYIRVFQLKSN